jgi:hypothetical protein
MCLQVMIDRSEIPTTPGKVVPVFVPEWGTVQLPLSKSAFAKEEHLRRSLGVLPWNTEAQAFAAAREKVSSEHGDGPQVFWLHSAFARGYIPGLTAFAERNPDSMSPAG